MDEEQIQRLLKEAEQNCDMMKVYEHTLLRMDIDALQAANIERPLTVEEVGANFAWVGFLDGIEFTLRNLILNIVKDEKPGE